MPRVPFYFGQLSQPILADHASYITFLADTLMCRRKQKKYFQVITVNTLLICNWHIDQVRSLLHAFSVAIFWIVTSRAKSCVHATGITLDLIEKCIYIAFFVAYREFCETVWGWGENCLLCFSAVSWHIVLWLETSTFNQEVILTPWFKIEKWNGTPFLASGKSQLAEGRIFSATR